MRAPVLPVALVLVAGCLAPDVEEGPGEGEERVCLVSVHAPVENVTYAYNLTWPQFEANAPRLAADLVEKAGRLKPFDLGGSCPWFEPEVQWLLSLYDEDPRATPSELFPGFAKHFYNLSYDGETQLSVHGRSYRPA